MSNVMRRNKKGCKKKNRKPILGMKRTLNVKYPDIKIIIK